MIRTPAGLAADMQHHLGVAPDEIIDDGNWHSAKSGKISYVTDQTKRGLLVRYRVKGDFETWQEECGEYIRSAPRPRRPPEPVIDDMPIMRQIWEEAGRVGLAHPYIEAKLIVPVGIRQTSKRYVIRAKTAGEPEHYISSGTLLVPAYSNTTGDIKAFTTITDKGRKFARGSISNCHLWIGGATGGGDGNLYIAEGYSTAISIHMRTRSPTVCAFSTSGLLPVGQMLRQRYPDASVVFAADNDLDVMFRADGKEQENPGVYYATKAAEVIGARLWIPPTEAKADWNDIHISMCPKTKTPVQF